MYLIESFELMEGITALLLLSDLINFFKSMIVKFGLAALALSSGAATLMPNKAKASRFAFDAVQANTFDTITVPRGYSWHTVVSWGDPMWSGVDEFDHKTRGTGASQELAFGDNNDGMKLFQHEGHYILAVNNEYTNLDIIHGNRDSGKPESPEFGYHCPSQQRIRYSV